MEQNKLFIEELKKDIARLEEVIKEKQALLNQLEGEEVAEEVIEEVDPLQADVEAKQLKGKIKYTITFPNGEVISATATKPRDFALIVFDESEEKKYSVASKGKIGTIESTKNILEWQIKEKNRDFKYFTIKLPNA